MERHPCIIPSEEHGPEDFKSLIKPSAYQGFPNALLQVSSLRDNEQEGTIPLVRASDSQEAANKVANPYLSIISFLIS